MSALDPAYDEFALNEHSVAMNNYNICILYASKVGPSHFRDYIMYDFFRYRNGHMNMVEYLIEKCEADLEQVGSVTFDGETIDGAPPIWCAAAAGYLPIVKFLIKAGTEVNKTTYTNSTPLRAACFDGHFDIVQYLVEHNADIEIANRHGHTCLMIACYKGHYRIVKFLLEKGANVNRKSLKGLEVFFNETRITYGLIILTS